MKKQLTREQRQALREHHLAVLLVIAFTLFVGICLGSAVTATWWTPEPEVVTKVIYMGTFPAAAEEEETAVKAAGEPSGAVYLGEYTVTYYCPCESCCGKTDGITATGTVATEGRTIAVDPTVIPYGSTVRLCYEDGSVEEYIAEDCGSAIRGNRLDVYLDSHEAALEAGVRTADVYVEVAGE